MILWKYIQLIKPNIYTYICMHMTSPLPHECLSTDTQYLVVFDKIFGQSEHCWSGLFPKQHIEYKIYTYYYVINLLN